MAANMGILVVKTKFSSCDHISVGALKSKVFHGPTLGLFDWVCAPTKFSPARNSYFPIGVSPGKTDNLQCSINHTTPCCTWFALLCGWWTLNHVVEYRTGRWPLDKHFITQGWPRLKALCKIYKTDPSIDPRKQWTAYRIFESHDSDSTSFQRSWLGLDKPGFSVEYSSQVGQIFEYSRTNQQIRLVGLTRLQIRFESSNIRVWPSKCRSLLVRYLK